MTDLAVRQADLLAIPDEKLREMYHSGDAAGAIRALRAQVDDFVDNDPLLQDFSRQLARGDGPGCLVMKGSATWAPVRAAGDWSAWGNWEAWEECAIGPCNGGTAVGPYKTGRWLLWNAATGLHMCPPGEPESARRRAEMLGVVLNEGRPTRVVEMDGTAAASAVDFESTARAAAVELQKLKEQIPEG